MIKPWMFEFLHAPPADKGEVAPAPDLAPGRDQVNDGVATAGVCEGYKPWYSFRIPFHIGCLPR